MSILARPPVLPQLSELDDESRDYFIKLSQWADDVYEKLVYQNMGDVQFSASDEAPTSVNLPDGKDGDMHIRVDGASTALYQNVNGVWTAI